MSIESYWLYVMVCLAATATPGPAVLLIMTNSIRFGLGSALVGVLGNVSCLLALCLISAFGIGRFLIQFPILFKGIEILGALFLLYIGFKNLLYKSALPGLSGQDGATEASYNGLVSKRHLYAEALMVAASNPKALIFVFALFPQFIDVNSASVMDFLILTVTLIAFSFLFLSMYAYLAHKVHGRFLSQNSVSWIYRASGAIFILASMGLLLNSNYS
ncbi:LysE family translocator [Salinicola sp. JS01]|uniref:LysE family translocator n=1 Tax=Salinicola sp. JS01 TaxID=3050071 RepID=UPI00255B5689|nr:LysE family translocator [Salinicola sp. JS01]WIX32986.1 LysE family translocator [Salinicola sp. JS01]